MGSTCSSIEAYREATEDAFFACLLTCDGNKLHVLRFARYNLSEERKRLPGISVAEFMRAEARPVALIPTNAEGLISRLSFRGLDIGVVVHKGDIFRINIGEKLSGEVSLAKPCLILNPRDPSGKHQLLTETILWARTSNPPSAKSPDTSFNDDLRKLICNICSPLHFQFHSCYWSSQHGHQFQCGLCNLGAPANFDEKENATIIMSTWEQLYWHLYFFHGLSRYYIAKYFARCLCLLCNHVFCLREGSNCLCPSIYWTSPTVKFELNKALEDNKGKVPDDLDPFRYLEVTQQISVMPPTPMPVIINPPLRTSDNDLVEPMLVKHRLTDFPSLSRLSAAASVQNLTASSRFPFTTELAIRSPLSTDFLLPVSPSYAHSKIFRGTVPDAWHDFLLRESAARAGLKRRNPRIFGDDDDSIESLPSNIPEPKLKLNLTGDSFRPRAAPALEVE